MKEINMLSRVYNFEEEYDKKDFERFLKSYYNAEEDEVIEKKLKNDIKIEKDFRVILEKSGYSTREFFTYSTKLFPKIFNKLTIKKITEYLNYDDKC